MAQPALKPTDSSSETLEVDEIFTRARAAQRWFEKQADQALLDRAALAAAWALMQPERNRELADMGVATTGLGNADDKFRKNYRKTLGLLRDLKGVKTTGVLRELPDRGLTEIARPIGVIGAVVPSTNPVATPVNKTVNALKCGNAIVLAPSPKGAQVCEKLIGYMHSQFDRIGIPHDLVQMLPSPPSKAKTARMMQLADLLVVTGSQANVRSAYTSGTPAIGVGVGNVTVLVDETANQAEAARLITASKTFDNATSCSSENNLVVVDAVYDEFVAEMAKAGGMLLEPAERNQLLEKLWQNGNLNRSMLAQDIDVVLRELALDRLDPTTSKFLLAEESGIGKDYPLSREKMALVASLYRARDFAHAKELADQLLRSQGAGHSIGLHTSHPERALEMGLELPTCRVIVNQAHCFATGGSFDNGMPFSLSMGCGSWGGNSVDGNVHYIHYMNITRIVRTIPDEEPAAEEIFGDYWAEFGK